MTVPPRRASKYLCGLLAVCCLLAAGPLAAQEPANEADRDRGADLVIKQERIKAKFEQFENKLLELAEATAATDPVRAELLRKAFQQGKEKDVNGMLDALVEILKQDRLGTAVSRQKSTTAELQALLDLLLSEDRPKNLADEKARIREYLKRVKQIRKQEEELRERNRRGGNAAQIGNRQGGIGDQTRRLGDDISRNEGGEGKPGEAKPGEGKPGEGKPGEGKPGEAKPGEGKPGEGKPGEAKPGEGKPGEGKPGEGKPGEGKPGEGKPGEGKPGEGKPGEGQPGEGQPGEGQPGQGQPGQGQPGQGQPGEGEPGEGSQNQPGDSGDPIENTKKKIREAEERMREAKQKLEKAQREGSLKDQEEAINALKQIEEELEQLLRQLREEEIERLLAYLEARFKKMLEMQVEVYEGTLRVDLVPDEQRDDPRFAIRSGKLSRDESRILLEADKALKLLEEDGTAVAMPEAVMQMQDDMEVVVARLSQLKVGQTTQGIEEEIIAALEEMIAALQKAQKELGEQQPPPPPGPSGLPGDPPLIDMLAELKMIKSLQLRVNRRTKRYSEQLKDADDEVGQATETDLQQLLDQLSGREDRIFRAARDIVTGRNK